MVDGTFQEYAVTAASHLTEIPEGVPLEVAAPVLCAGVTVYRAIKNANVKPGDYIVIAGAGGKHLSLGVYLPLLRKVRADHLSDTVAQAGLATLPSSTPSR